MANTQGGPLEFEFDIKLQKFEAKLHSVENQLSGMTKQAVTQTSKIDKIWAGTMATAGAYFTGQAIGRFVMKIGQIRGEFQKLEAVLTNSFGDASRAKSALSMIQEFASKTPFQVTDLTSSFVKLVNQGFEPTMEHMTALGDLASSTGKGFDQLTEAIIDAQTMEFERLKEFGIRASKEGDKITFTFKGQQTTIDATAESIREYILSLGKMTGVTGAMEAISKTLVGQLSNMEDAWDQLLNTLGTKSEGIFSTVIGWLSDLITMINDASQSMDQIELKVNQKAISESVNESLKEIAQLAEGYEKIGKTTQEASEKAWEDHINSLTRVINDAIYAQMKAQDDLKEARDKNKGDFFAQIFDKKDESGMKLDDYIKSVEIAKEKVLVLRQTLESLQEVRKKETGKDKKTVTVDELKDFEKYISTQKKLYKQFEDIKSTSSLENAKRLYPKLEESYKNFLLKLREKYQDNPAFAGVIATELAPIFEEGQLEKLPRIEAFWEKQKKVNVEGLKITKVITREQIEQRKSIEAQAEATQDLRSEWEKQRDLIELIINLSSELLQIFSGLTNESNQFGLAMNNLSNSLQSKSIAEGFVKFAVGVIKDWIVSSKELKELRIQVDIDRISSSLERLNFQLDNVDRAADANKVEAYRIALQDLRQAGEELERQFNKLGDNKKINLWRDFDINFGAASIEELQDLIVKFSAMQNTEDKKENKINAQRLEQLREMLELKQRELDIQNEIDEALTGTTSASISDSIAAGFEDGLTSVQDFGTKTEEILKKAILKSFQSQYIQPFIDSWYKKFVKAAESDGLSQTEVDYLTQNMNAGYQQFLNQWKPFEEMISGMTGSISGQTSLAGGFKGLQEDTANVLAGTLNSMRIIGIRTAEIAESSNTYLARIADNTNFNRQIPQIITGLKAVELAVGSSLTSNRANGR